MRKPFQVEGIVFKKEGDQTKFLLLKRTESRGGFWQPITGGVEGDEEIDDALIREMKEETGINNFINILKKIHYFELPPNSIKRVQSNDPIKEYVYGIEVNENTVIQIDESEHTEFRWVSYEGAINLLKWENNKTAISKLKERLDRQ